LDGALQVDQADIDDAEHIDEKHGQTLTQYVQERFGITQFTGASVLMVRAKRVAETEHI
jgi:hypothetical protein